MVLFDVEFTIHMRIFGIEAMKALNPRVTHVLAGDGHHLQEWRPRENGSASVLLITV